MILITFLLVSRGFNSNERKLEMYLFHVKEMRRLNITNLGIEATS